MFLESLPPWVLWLVGVTGVISAASLSIQFGLYQFRKYWPNGNGNGSKAKGFICPVDTGHLAGQLGECHNHREAAAERDARMLSMLKQLIEEVRGLRGDWRQLHADIVVLKDRTERFRP